MSTVKSTVDSRRRLAEALAWARRNGWERSAWPGHYRSYLADLVWYADQGALELTRRQHRGDWLPDNLRLTVESIDQALDALVGLHILPAEFGSF